MDHSLQMKSYLAAFIKKLSSDHVYCSIPRRKGLRKIMDNHVFHDHPEIFLQISGSTHFSFPNEMMILREGHMLIVPPELPHGEILEDSSVPFETVVITPAMDFLQCHISRESKLGRPMISHYETIENMEKIKIRQYTDLLIEEKASNDSTSSIVVRGLLMALLGSVSNLLSYSQSPLNDNNKIREVKNTVLSNYHNSSLSVAQLANQLSCSADYLSWLFHRETGTTLNIFINQLRLKKAADLLKNTDYTISEISWICGYKNPAYFSRVFSKNFQTSPRNFREN